MEEAQWGCSAGCWFALGNDVVQFHACMKSSLSKSSLPAARSVLPAGTALTRGLVGVCTQFFLLCWINLHPNHPVFWPLGGEHLCLPERARAGSDVGWL